MVAELTEQETTEFLKSHRLGRIGCNDGKRTYVVPLSYVYSGPDILCHSRGGLKIEMMRRNPSVCIEVDDVTDYRHWKSVIAWGEYEELTNDKEIDDAHNLFKDKNLSIKFSLSAMPPNSVPDGQRVEKPESTELVFFRIRITEMTGRYETS
jgi:uncharacterized protein